MRRVRVSSPVVVIIVELGTTVVMVAFGRVKVLVVVVLVVLVLVVLVVVLAVVVVD